MAHRGTPYDSKMVRYTAALIAPDNFKEGIASYGWFQRFVHGRHAEELRLKKTSTIDLGHAAWSRWSVMEKFFKEFESLVEEHNLWDKPDRFYNIDETGFGDKQLNNFFVVPKGMQAPYIRQAFTREHTTVATCLSADGKVLPPFIVFQNNLPDGDFATYGPQPAGYSFNSSGYMNGDLYYNYIVDLVEPYMCKDRPVVLLQDNLAAHNSLRVREFCISKGIHLVNIPPHTSHILQPCDQVFYALKCKFSSLALMCQYLRDFVLINQSKFPALLKVAIERALIPTKVKHAWKVTGLFPPNIHNIDKTKLVADEDDGAGGDGGGDAGGDASQPSTSGSVAPGTATITILT